MSQVKMLREAGPKDRILSAEEERCYLLASSQPLQDIAVVMVDTGMRPEEVFRMKGKDVDLHRGTVFNPHGKSRNARRTIPLTQRARDVIAARVAEKGSGFVFENEETGKPLTTLKTAHKGAIRRSGVDHFRLYDLRHTFATRFIEAGGDLMTLKDLLGHSSIQMVSRYAHPTEDHKFEAIRRMEEKRAAKTGKVLKMRA